MGKSIRYRFAVTATLPLTDDPWDPDFYTEAGATDPKRQREYEKTILHALRKVEGDCDVELLDYTVEDDDAA